VYLAALFNGAILKYKQLLIEVSWISSRAFRPFLQATQFETTHLVLVAVFLGANCLPKAASFASSTNCHRLSLSFGTLSFNFFFGGFDLGASSSAELSSLDSVRQPPPHA